MTTTRNLIILLLAMKRTMGKNNKCIEEWNNNQCFIQWNRQINKYM